MTLFKKVFWLLLLFVVMTNTSTAWAEEPEVHTAEILRRGNSVVITGEGPRASDEDAMLQAMAPPADDTDQWHVILFSGQGCAPCEKLRADFEKNPLLACYVAALAPNKPWANWYEFKKEDPTQQFRFKAFKVDQVPVLVIMPPRSGVWGDPSTVVLSRAGYDGDAKKLSADISATVKRYAAKKSREGYPKQPVVNLAIKGGAGQQSPFGPIPSTTPINPTTIPPLMPSTPVAPSTDPSAPLDINQLLAAIPNVDTDFIKQALVAHWTLQTAVAMWNQMHPVTPPTPTLPGGNLLLMLSGGTGIIALLHLGLKIWDMYRQGLTLTGKTPLVPQNVVDILHKLVDSNTQLAQSVKASTILPPV